MRAAAALLFAFTAVIARAGDPPAPAADSIADAKKDLAEIKVPQAQLDTAATVPLVDMKDLGPGPGGPRLEMPTLLSQEKDASLDPTKKKLGTGNWLVDAMEKKSDGSAASRAKEKDEILKGDPELLRPDEKLALQAERDLLPANGSTDKQAPKEAAVAVYNPLDSFMNSWVSARDHDLLVPTSKGRGRPPSTAAGRMRIFCPGWTRGSRPRSRRTCSRRPSLAARATPGRRPIPTWEASTARFPRPQRGTRFPMCPPLGRRRSWISAAGRRPAVSTRGPWTPAGPSSRTSPRCRTMTSTSSS